jgi:hypothetical protein
MMNMGFAVLFEVNARSSSRFIVRLPCGRQEAAERKISPWDRNDRSWYFEA